MRKLKKILKLNRNNNTLLDTKVELLKIAYVLFEINNKSLNLMEEESNPLTE